MTDAPKDDRDMTLAETMEKLREQHYPHVDRRLVLEILRAHADQGASPQDLARATDEAVAESTKGTG